MMGRVLKQGRAEAITLHSQVWSLNHGDSLNSVNYTEVYADRSVGTEPEPFARRFGKAPHGASGRCARRPKLP